MSIADLRREYHRSICERVLRINNGIPNIADINNQASKAISLLLIDQLGCLVASEDIAGQSKGTKFEQITKDFLRNAFELLSHLRPGKWRFDIGLRISRFEQYRHLAYL